MRGVLNIIVPFKRWIKKYEADSGLLGDLASDIQHDDRFPDYSQSHYVIRNYLIGMSACEVALDTFENIWKLYEREAK